MTNVHGQERILEQKLEQRILHGIALEWTHAVSHLTATPKISLQMPLFSLRDLNGNWGM